MGVVGRKERKKMKSLILIAILFLIGCSQTPELTERQLRIKENVVDLRVPGKWREAGKQLVQDYPHEEEFLLGELFDAVLPDHQIQGQMRNAPILWVLVMIKETYGDPKLKDSQVDSLFRLRGSKEVEGEAFGRHLNKLIRGYTPPEKR